MLLLRSFFTATTLCYNMLFMYKASFLLLLLGIVLHIRGQIFNPLLCFVTYRHYILINATIPLRMIWSLYINSHDKNGMHLLNIHFIFTCFIIICFIITFYYITCFVILFFLVSCLLFKITVAFFLSPHADEFFETPDDSLS